MEKPAVYYDANKCFEGKGFPIVIGSPISGVATSIPNLVVTYSKSTTGSFQLCNASLKEPQ